MNDKLTDGHKDGGLPASEWAGGSGERWLANLDGLERMIEPIGTALLTQAGYRPGERVIDIGCGGGWTSRQIARAVGPDGAVTGLDISPALVEAARSRAEAEGIANIAFELGDAGVAMPASAPFDRLFSRFGTMFFDDPYAAFANLRCMVADGGRLDIAVWARAGENPWFVAVTDVLARHVEMPKPAPRAPGPFALGEPEYLRDLLTRAGFAEPHIVPWEGAYYIGGPGNKPDAAAAFVLESMHVADLLKGDRALQDVVREDLARVFAAHETANGVALSAKVLFVSAEAGEQSEGRRGDPARKNKLGVRYDEPQTSVSPAGGARHEL